MSNQAINVSVCRRSTRIATAVLNHPSMSSTHIRLTDADHSRGRSLDAGQPQPSLLKLLSHLKPDFTHADIHACEETVLSAGGYVYLDVILPYYQDAEARLLGTTVGELDATSILLGMSKGKEAGKKEYDRGVEQLKATARAEGRYGEE